MTTLNVHFKGQTHALVLPTASPTVGDLQAAVERVSGVQQDAQRLFQQRRRVDCSDAARALADACDCSPDAAPLTLMAGASAAQIQSMKSAQDAAQREMRVRESRRVVDISRRNQGLQARDAVATSYRFHAIEPLGNFSDKHKAQEILERLANDRGILAVMVKHKWSVGVLAEMPPDGKVGVDPVCVLGLNQNKGQKILLRLRTDDLLGFRKFLSIKKVLFHELSHNVHSEHDSKFYQLMRQVEKECNELDWTSSHGAAVGGTRTAPHDEITPEISSSSGHRLGASPQQDEASQSHLNMTEMHERTVDEEVATLAMSDRERRVHDAVRHLQTQYSPDAIAKAVSLLHKIVSNIITHPADIKFRSIRKANRLFEGQVARFPECLEFLLALGFEDQADKFVLVREDPALLWIGRSTLEVLLPAAA
ncbi:Protein involved in sister chromatid separation and/or segregation [Phytophthora cinnamomi]|uniref:Protein involved in sister chromatid separation and/or segregation n=1 Tax=Phytophthora cinnamomi TaxID=4785 RepID=UPI003559AA26|nr:Protein involved in sister chromatid separation and/or segregation [Phytophthora cinnamomi]